MIGAWKCEQISADPGLSQNVSFQSVQSDAATVFQKELFIYFLCLLYSMCKCDKYISGVLVEQTNTPGMEVRDQLSWEIFNY